MKLVKLWTHKNNFSEHELVLNPKEFPELTIGDVVEIYHPEVEASRLLLQVRTLSEDFQQKDTISVSSAVTSNPHFSLRIYQDVAVTKVTPKDVGLDLVELIYKEQYFSRADMWRLKKHLTNTCQYLQKKVEFSEMRVEVEGLWSKGQQVTCGYCTDETRVTYRSLTAQVNIFIQMSSEMWEFDNYGDLYFEKAVNGFLIDLFNHWKDYNCNHDVTITMFSRTYYEAQSLDDFPMHMRECVQQDVLGRYYEDFYRVVVQNERYDEWTNTVQELKKIFNEYPDHVLHYHDQPTMRIPRAWNSNASNGNFLEVLNMALNTYEKFYMDRNFDRTGKLSIVITPGPGVFEVDRELTHITKQRTIDIGNSSDLVCMGEQPLHAAPLLKFITQTPTMTDDVGDDYNIPHWINHSFYTSDAQAERMKQGKFIPRIRMPTSATNPTWCSQRPYGDYMGKRSFPVDTSSSNAFSSDDVPFNDYDDYDEDIFKLPSFKSITTPLKSQCSVWDNRVPRLNFTGSVADLFQPVPTSIPMLASMSKPIAVPVPSPKIAQNYMPNSYAGEHAANTKPGDNSQVGSSDMEGSDRRHTVGSMGSPTGHENRRACHKPRRALINPFAPSRLHFKVTSNRRRWAHAYPTDPRGAAVQHHHRHGSEAEMSRQSSLLAPSDILPDPLDYVPKKEVMLAAQMAVEMRKYRAHKMSESSDGQDYLRTKASSTESGSLDSLGRGGGGGGLKKVSSSSGLIHVDSTSSMSSLVAGYSDKETGPVVFSLSSSTGGRPRILTTMYPSLSRSASLYRGTTVMGGEMPEQPPEEGHCWLWGITGEQEWTPEIKTGMDWKSMTRPSSLPLTTDYFPDNATLEKDYVKSQYTLLPDDINNDSWTSQSRQLLSTLQVYNEMVAQRISQGFQLIIQGKSVSHGSGVSRDSVTSGLSCSPYQAVPPSSSLRRRMKADSPDQEHILSIGRIFQRLTLKGPEITVFKYWPRHPYPEKSYHYAYRFQVPDSESYDVSWTDFKNEKMENYKWNYVDQYICTRGEEDYVLEEGLKYWRARLFLIPINNPSTAKIRAGTDRCDIYEDFTQEEQQAMNDGYVRLMETLNKIRRPTAASRKSKKEATRRHSITVSPLPGSLQHDKDKMAEHVKAKVMNKVTGGTESPIMSPSAGTPKSDAVLSPVRREDSPVTSKQQDDNIRALLDSLSICSPSMDIIQAMVHPTEGLSFLKGHQELQRLPENSFIAAEAVSWVISFVDGVIDTKQAVTLMQRLLEERLICHSSGRRQHKFVYGFYIYCVCWQDGTTKKDAKPLDIPFNTGFQYEWCEVAIHNNPRSSVSAVPAYLMDTVPKHPSSVASTPTSALSTSGADVSSMIGAEFGWAGRTQFAGYSMEHPNFFQDFDNPDIDQEIDTHPLDANYMHRLCSAQLGREWWHTSPRYKVVYVDVDPTLKSDRAEFGIAHYHGNYNPCAAFEIEVQWLVASGCILGDLIQTWSRKASSCGFHFLPVPSDPFALPFTPNSDPLRGPIFVPLNIEDIKDPDKDLFEDFPAPSREERMQLFQDTILRRFGFIPDQCLIRAPTPASYPDAFQPTYVHVSGGMFAMIPDNKTASPRNRDGTHRHLRISSHKEYIVRRSCTSDPGGTVASSASSAYTSYFRTGFLWSWNFMLTKRWRTPHTGDEAFQDAVLADFRAFCRNDDGRLRQFWQEGWEKAQPEEERERMDAADMEEIKEEEEALIDRMMEGKEDYIMQDPLLNDE